MYLEVVKKKRTVLPVYTVWLVFFNFGKPKRFAKVFSCSYNGRLGGFVTFLSWRKLVGLSRFAVGVFDLTFFFDMAYYSSYMFLVTDLGCFISSFYRFGIICARCLFAN